MPARTITKAETKRRNIREEKLELRADKIEEISTDVRERLIFIIDNEFISGRFRYQYLEERYGIAARKWKNVCNRVQLPSIEMLSCILNDHPYLSSWLLTGWSGSLPQVDPTKEGWEQILKESLWKPILEAHQRSVKKIPTP